MLSVNVLKDGTIITQNGFEIFHETKIKSETEAYDVWRVYWKDSHVSDCDTLFEAVSYCQHITLDSPS